MFQRHFKAIRLMTPCLFVALAAGTALGQCGAADTLSTFDRAASDGLGGARSMAAQNGYLMAGVGNDDNAKGSQAGSVHVFGRVGSNWTEFNAFVIYAADGSSNDLFGASVGYSDPYSVIGAPGTAAAYFFERNGGVWNQKTRVNFPDADAGASFGHAVAISGGWAAVTAPWHDTDGSPNVGMQNPDSGAVYMYKRNAITGAWSLMQSIDYTDSFGFYSGNKLGFGVAISGDYMIAGAPYGGMINWPAEHGYARIWHRVGDTWQIDTSDYGAYHVPNDAQASAHYGYSVDMAFPYAAIGAPDMNSTAAQTPAVGAKADCGAVYLRRYSNGGWYNDGEVFPSDASVAGRFGTSVKLYGDILIVGAGGSHKSYVFRRMGPSQWVQTRIINDPDGVSSQFGSGLAFDGQSLLVGDETASPGGVGSAGAIYSFEIGSAPAETCAGATPITGPGPYTGCTTGAAVDGVSNCGTGGGGPGPDVWFSWTPDCAGNVIFDTFGSAYDTVLSVHSGCPATVANTVACNDDGFPGIAGNLDSLVTFNYTAGTTYYIRVAGYNGHNGAFNLRMQTYAPANDHCAQAQVVTAGSTPWRNCYADTDGVGSTNMVHDVWFKYIAPVNGTVTITTCGSGLDFDTMLAVYTGNVCPTAASVATVYDDDQGGCAPGHSRVTFNATAGQTYIIQAGGFPWDALGYSSWSNGEALLNISLAQHGCNAADIATAGNPDPNAGPDGFLTGEDFDLYVQAYFKEFRNNNNALIADLTDGLGSGGPDGFITGTDFDKFVQLYYAGC